jgi:lipopolysaccharide export system permease protein
VNVFKIEKHQRNAIPFSTIILTLLAVPIASRKVRGGIGFHLAIGIALAFTYIFMQKVTTTYAVNNALSPFMAVWLPNFIYAIVGLVLTKFAQK